MHVCMMCIYSSWKQVRSNALEDSVSVSLQCCLVVCYCPLYAMHFLSGQALAVELSTHAWFP